LFQTALAATGEPLVRFTTVELYARPGKTKNTFKKTLLIVFIVNIVNNSKDITLGVRNIPSKSCVGLTLSRGVTVAA
jgi:hypothetical protein